MGVEVEEIKFACRVDEVLLTPGPRGPASGAVARGELAGVTRVDLTVDGVVGGPALDPGNRRDPWDVHSNLDPLERVWPVTVVIRVADEHDSLAGGIRGDLVGTGHRNRADPVG